MELLDDKPNWDYPAAVSRHVSGSGACGRDVETALLLYIFSSGGINATRLIGLYIVYYAAGFVYASSSLLWHIWKLNLSKVGLKLSHPSIVCPR